MKRQDNQVYNYPSNLDIRDEETGLIIKHITTSPITNHVTPFYPDLEGR